VCAAIWSIFTARRNAVSVRPSVCLCVCVSVTLRYCVKMAKRRITQIMPHDRPGTLFSNRMFFSCRIYTDKRVARSLCHSRATCYHLHVIITVHFAIDGPSLVACSGNYNWWAMQYGRFLPRDAMLSAVYAVVVSLSVCLCVCLSHSGIVSKRLNVESRK